MEALKGDAERLYAFTIRSPGRYLSILVAMSYAILTILNPLNLIVLAVAALAIVTMKLCSCMKLNARRIAGMLLYTLPVVLVLEFTPHPLCLGSRLLVVPLFTALLIAFCSLRVALVYAVAATTSLYLLAHPSLQQVALVLVFTLAFVLLSIYAVGSPRNVRLLTGAIRAWADDDYDMLEGFIRENSESYQAVIDVYDFNGVKLVAPRIHYGPFRMACSSRLPLDLRRVSGNLIPLHTCGSHELNLASRDDVERVVNTVKEMLHNTIRCKPVKPKLVSLGTWNAAILGCIEKPLVVAWRSDGMEDVPCANIPTDIVFVDAHNKEVDRVELSGLNRLITAVREALEPCTEEVSCCIEIRSSDNVVHAGGCQPWFAVVKQCCGTECAALVVIPSNNIELAASEEYTKRLPHNAILVTIDDHSCSAVGENAAPSLKFDERLAEELRRAIEACKPRECSIGLATNTVSVHVWGSKLARIIPVVIKRGLRAARASLLLYALIVLAASL